MGRGEGATDLFTASNGVDPKQLLGRIAVVPLGAPGAGKGTQSKILSGRLGYPHVSTGDILRGATEWFDQVKGETIGDLLDKGEFASDETMYEIIADRLTKPDTAEGIILDGFPRNLAQVEVFEEMTAAAGFAPPIAIEIVVSDSEATERILARGEGRSDDTPEVVAERLRIYHERTAPLINFYRSRNRLATIDGERPVENVSKEILKAYLRLVERAAERR